MTAVSNGASEKRGVAVGAARAGRPLPQTKFIRNFIYVIGGFTQKTGADTGMMRLWARLFRWRARTKELAFTFLMPREWDDSVREMAELVNRHGVENRSPKIVIAGYSWGAGYGAIRLAKALGKAGHSVDLLLLIDPVYRSTLPLFFRLLAFTTWFGITIPSNVRRVGVWRQRNAGPRGTNILPEDARVTEMIFEIDMTDAGLTHATIQYDESVLRACFESAVSTISAARGHR